MLIIDVYVLNIHGEALESLRQNNLTYNTMHRTMLTDNH
ncbi:hypothetical protein BTN49_3033 [Candidatus Enterovibrio escicola]|uniref:Uncharacterized protein n=1 Tax=Candidatus Enterovibrio escicola TaxID=1927127 RepID=A0A2A5T005_9GAMM|nr:hypothetical protein BTN49_3033 [Candidatus Enterovibrio escacola]